MLVQDGGNTAHGRGDAAERGRAVAVQVQDVDLLPIDDLQQRGQRRRDRISTCEDK